MKLLPHVLLCMVALCLLAACADEAEDDAGAPVAQEQAEAPAPEAAADSGAMQEQAPEEQAALTGDDRQDVLDSCLEAEGTTPDICECVVDGMIEEFSAEEFVFMAAAIREDPNLPNGVPGMDAQRVEEGLNKAFEGCGLQ